MQIVNPAAGLWLLGLLILLLKQTAARCFKRALNTLNQRIEEYNSRIGCSMEKEVKQKFLPGCCT
ncbi:MAG: hypothetical protein ACOX42_08715 [Clostridia bacterium]